MGMTITEKILAAHAGRDSVSPGEKVWCKVDVLLTHDVCGPGTIGIFEKEFGVDAAVFDPDSVTGCRSEWSVSTGRFQLHNVLARRQFQA